MRSSRAVLGLCTRCASLEPMALTSTPCEQSATLNRILYAGPAWWGYADEGWADSCEDCLRLVSPARQMRTSTPQSAQPNSNCSTGYNPTNFTYCGHCFLL